MGSRRVRWAWVVAVAVATALVGLALAVLPDDGDDAATSPRTTGMSASPPSSTSGPAPSTAPTVVPPPPAPTTPPPSGSDAAVVVRQGGSARRVVALTFDAGSDTGYAAEILDTLAANGVAATFGMTGTWARANPGLVRRMAAEGHQLVNHSDDHPSFTGRSTGQPPLSRTERLDQLARADAAVRGAAGVSTIPWFRPPYGDEDASVRADVGSAGYRYELLWSVDPLGWRGASADAVVERALDAAEPGAVYLFHVGAASADHAALQRIVDGLRSGGYGFVTAAGMVSA